MTKPRTYKALESAQRELEIQASLERVRAKALGMQESGEWKGVATVFRNECEDMGYPMDRVSIHIKVGPMFPFRPKRF